MANILCLETASTNCSVALFREGEMLGLREDRTDAYTHGEELHGFIEEVLREAGVSPEDLDAVAVGKGPGSFTGLRIGVSAAKGLCFALNIPLIGLPTLGIMARTLKPGSGVLIPMLDARRMEVYASVYDLNYREIRETRAEILTPESFSEYRGAGTIHLLGSGAEKSRELLTDAVFRFYPKALPTAEVMGPMAQERYANNAFEDLAYFEPYYLKDFIPGGGKG